MYFVVEGGILSPLKLWVPLAKFAAEVGHNVEPPVRDRGSTYNVVTMRF